MTRPTKTEARFEWHELKAETNKRKHRVSFPFAAQVFRDPLVDQAIEGDEHGEIRWRAIGQVGRILIRVTYTTREEEDITIIRIISARKADRRERRAYEENPKDDG
jgi:uncharacterized DUF497 family protein